LENIETKTKFCSRKNSSVFVNDSYYPSLTTDIVFVVHGVFNPNSTASTNSFYVQTYDENDRVICKSYSNYIYSATPGSLNVLGSKRSASIAGDSFNLSMELTTSNDFPQGGLIQVIIPLEQGILFNNTPFCQIFKNNVYSKQNCVSSNKTDGVEIWIDEWCSNSKNTCSKVSNLKLEINYALINPYFISQNVNKLFY